MLINKQKMILALVANTLILVFLWIGLGPPGLAPRAAGSYRGEPSWFKTVKLTQWSNIQFDSHASDPELSKVKVLRVDGEARFRTVDIRFRMKAYAIPGLSDVFQTANENDGIRLEIFPPATLNLVAGYVDKKKNSTPKGFETLTNFKANQWYVVHVTIDNGNRIHILVNDESDLSLGMHIVEDTVGEYDVSEIAVGSGFSQTRHFDGVVRDFNLEYRLLDWSSPLKQAFTLIYLPLMVSLILMCVILSGMLFYQYRFATSLWAKPHTLNRRDKIRCVVLIMTVGFISSAIFHYARGRYWGQGFPLDTPYPIPADLGGDMRRGLELWMQSHFFGIGFGLSYFPSAYILFDILAKLKSIDRAFHTAALLFSGFTAIYVYKNLRTSSWIESMQTTVVCAFTSYPFLFTLQTGNMEMFVFMFLAAFVYFFQKKRYVLSSVCLAMPLSMKMFPGVFLVLFLSERRYKEFFLTLLWAFVLTVVPLWIYDGGIRSGVAGYLARLHASQDMYAGLMIIGKPGIHYGHSLLGAVRIIAGSSFPAMQAILMPYLILTIELFVCIVLYILCAEKVFWKKVALLVIAMNVLPYTSTDYKLMHLFIPLVLFINDENKDALDIPYVVLFSLMLIPKDYFYFQNTPMYSLNTLLNPFLMLTIAALIMVSRFTTSRPPSNSVR